MNGFELIEQERKRQIEVEGFDADHDAQHSQVTLANAARCYLIADDENAPRSLAWPWEPRWWKPKDKERNLVRAGALFLAAADAAEKDADNLGIHNLEASSLRKKAEVCGNIIDQLKDK